MENEEKTPTEITEKNKNKISPLALFIIIAGILMIGMCGFICYSLKDTGSMNTKRNNNRNNTIVKEKESEEQPSTNNEEESNSTKEKTSQIEDENLSSEKKVEEIATYFGSYFPLENVNTINNQNLLFFALQHHKGGWQDTIPKEELEDVIKEYFGNKVKLIHENIECPSPSDERPLYLYDGNGTYKTNPEHGGHGGDGVKFAYVHYLSEQKNANIVEVNYKIAYSNNCPDTCITYAYYASYNAETPVVSNTKTDGAVDILEFTDELYESIKDKLPVTTFTYEIDENGTYNLIKIAVK